MKIFIIRHGETKHNKNRIFQGWRDTKLSQKGINDAKNKYKTIPKDFDICFSSTLSRAIDTAKILAPYLEIIEDSRIKERKLGKFENTIVTSKKLKLLDSNEPPKGGETKEEIDTRIKSFLEMLKENYKDKKILVVTHSGTVLSIYRVLNKKYDGIGNLEMREIEI